ncbi:MAG: hypothetical protein LBL93_00225 [Ruminococcus sp.]|jgi:aspartyl-tRNA synthetase|nr:hypothetical protein [Ruminococcus sp.]
MKNFFENAELRRKIKKSAYNFFTEEEFSEFDTPILVPLQGEIYNSCFKLDNNLMLADSPQVFKQYLMFKGVKRYFQFAHCFRPVQELNSPGNIKLPEFMQIDAEISDVNSVDELIGFAEKLLRRICDECGKSLTTEVISGKKCREEYGNDFKPLIKSEKDDELKTIIIKHMPIYSGEKTAAGTFVPCHHIFALPILGENDLPISDFGNLNSAEKENYLENILTESFDIVINGIEVGGGDLRINDRKLQEEVMDIFSVRKELYDDYLAELESYSGKNGGFAFGLERLMCCIL